MSVQNQALNTNKAVKLSSKQGFVTPAVDIYGQDGNLTLVADMPGVMSDALAIDVEQGILTIEGTASLHRQGTSLFSEFSPAGYYRQFRLSDDLDVNKIDAQFDNGVLTLRVAKVPTAVPRRIEVKTLH